MTRATPDRRPWRVGSLRLAAIAVALMVASGELDRLVHESLGANGQSFGIGDVTGVLAIVNDRAWSVWATAAISPIALLIWSVVFDALFVACYAVLLWRFEDARGWRFAVGAVVALELLETVAVELGIILLIAQDQLALATFGSVQTGISTAKWVAIGVLVLWALKEYRGRIARNIARAYHLLWIHRMAVLVVGIVGIVSVVPQAGVLEQLPDIQRAWIDWDGRDDLPVVNPLQILISAVMALLLWVVLFGMGRIRSEVFIRTENRRTRMRALAIDHNARLKREDPGNKDYLSRAQLDIDNKHLPAGMTFTKDQLRQLDMMADPRKEPGKKVYWLWLAAPALILVCGFILFFVGGGTLAYIDLWPFIPATVLLILIPAISWGLRGAAKNSARSLAPRRPFGPGDPRSIAAPDRVLDPDKVIETGDSLSKFTLTVAGIGMVRSFVAPALLIHSADPAASGGLPLLALYSGLGAVAGLLIVVGGEWLVGVLDRWMRRGIEASQTRRERKRSAAAGTEPLAVRGYKEMFDPRHKPTDNQMIARGLVAGIAVSILLSLTIKPLQVTAHLGALATAILILLSWAFIFVAVESIMQTRRPLPLVRLLGLRSAPLLTLFLLVPFLLSQVAGSPAVHAIQTGTRVDAAGPLGVGLPERTPPRAPSDRPTLAEAIEDWTVIDADEMAQGQKPCIVGTGSLRYRPLVLVAAQGGGIRAATWTVDVMRKFLVNSDCSRDVVLMSSGASGGSVGLAMFNGVTPETDKVTTGAIAGPEALSAGLAGTLVSDVLATTTGLRTPSRPGYVADDGTWIWQDRAALIQAAWATKARELARPYGFDDQEPTGLTIFNSTVAGTGCRAVVSQLDLGIGRAPRDPVTHLITAGCNSDTPPVSNMIDIQSYCPLDVDLATAMMFSARFPVVTPAARIPDSGLDGCAALKELQFADGGYAENSGLGTLSDLAPDLARLIALQNSRREGPPIVPLVLYIRNEVGADVTAQSAAASSELLVPLLALSTKDALTADNAWLQRLSSSLADVCDPTDLPCRWGVEEARKDVAGGIAVAVPSTRPAVIPPLGWTLSDTSSVLLAVEADAQMIPSCPGDRDTSYGRLGDLMNLFAIAKVDCPDPE